VLLALRFFWRVYALPLFRGQLTIAHAVWAAVCAAPQQSKLQCLLYADSAFLRIALPLAVTCCFSVFGGVNLAISTAQLVVARRCVAAVILVDLAKCSYLLAAQTFLDVYLITNLTLMSLRM
jgi:hypothetical protein